MNLAIFDIDGTLTNTNNVDEGCFVKAFAEAHSIDDIVTDWAAYPHTTDSGITQHIFQEKFGRSPEETELSKLTSCFVSMLSEYYQSDSASFAEIAGASAVVVRRFTSPRLSPGLHANGSDPEVHARSDH